METPLAATAVSGRAEGRNSVGETATFRHAEPSPHIDLPFVLLRWLVTIDIFQGLVGCCKEQTLSHGSPDLSSLAFGFQVWQSLAHRWIWIRSQHADKLLQSVVTNNRFLSQCLVDCDGGQYPRDIVGSVVRFLNQG